MDYDKDGKTRPNLVREPENCKSKSLELVKYNLREPSTPTKNNITGGQTKFFHRPSCFMANLNGVVRPTYFS